MNALGRMANQAVLLFFRNACLVHRVVKTMSQAIECQPLGLIDDLTIMAQELRKKPDQPRSSAIVFVPREAAEDELVFGKLGCMIEEIQHIRV
jgi:hypothetical protein